MGGLLIGLGEELIKYGTDDLPRFQHALKAALAVVVSMLICMRLELRAPGTAMVSAAIVMIHQQSGMVIARAFYRALGIVWGSLAGLTLICLFAQQPPLFLAGLSLWIGLFVAGSSYYKNFQSYGFVLSGYAASITAVPEWSNPYDVSTNVIFTVSEVVIGVTVSSLVSALVLPQRVTPALKTWRHNALTKLLPALRAAAGGGAIEEHSSQYLQLIQESVAIEGLRTAAVFEDPEMRLRNESLLHLEEAYLDVVTRIHAIYRVRQLTNDAGRELKARIDRIFGQLVSVVSKAEDAHLRDEDALETLCSQLAILERKLPEFIAKEMDADPDANQENRQKVEMAGAEIFAAASALRGFCGASQIGLAPPRIQLTQSTIKAISFMRHVPIRSSGTVALIAGVRAAIAVGFVGAAWIVSEWTNGFSALVSVAISSGLYSLTNAPVSASWQAFVGCLLAWCLGFLFNFLVFPLTGDVTLICVCVAIAVFVGSYVNTFKKYAILGAGFNLYFSYILSPTNPTVYNPTLFLDRGFSLLFGIACAATAFALIVPHEGEWLAAQYSLQIRRLLVRAATGTVTEDSSAQIGRSLRDLIVHLVGLPNVQKLYRDAAINWAFGALWIANTVARVRLHRESEGHLTASAWNVAEREWLEAIEHMARRASPEATETAISSTERALEVLELEERQAAGKANQVIFEMRTRLHSARIALIDQRALLRVGPSR
jgi:uncharacterized membrane protein YccC